MSRLDLSRSLAGLLLAVLFAGCQSAKKNGDAKGDNEDTPTKYDDEIVGPFTGDDLYANVPKDKVKINDEEVDSSNEKKGDYYETVAKWATERRDLITWCLHEEVAESNQFGQYEHRYKRVWPDDKKRPQTRLDQAVAIGAKVIEKIPGNTRERVRLAWCLFYKGSAEYWAVDACMNRINVLKAEMGDDEKNPKYPEKVAEIKKLRAYAEPASVRMLKYHRAALTHFNSYLASMPMDKAVLDFIWKIHFELADFREAVRVMNQLLDEDMLKEEIKLDYLKIRKEINEYLVEREINKEAPKPSGASILKGNGRLPGE